MRIAVLGAGGVGGYLAARLADAGADVSLVARGRHLAALQQHGLTLRSVLGDTHVTLPATDETSEIGPVDVVLFCTKSTDTDAASAALPPLLGDRTAVVSFQNGVGNEQRIADAIGPGHVVGGVALIFSTIAEPGVVEHTGGPARFVFGELDGSTSDRLVELADWFDRAGIDHELSPDINGALWRKLTFICGQAGTTAAIGLPIGEILADEAARRLLAGLFAETAAVARANGVSLPDDLVETNLGFAAGLDPAMRSSLHHDLSHGKPMELDALHGTVLRLGEELGVEVPMTRAIHAVLGPWAARNRTPAPAGGGSGP